MSETKQPKDQKLVPDFAVEESEPAEWGQLTHANPDYEKLWSAEAWAPPEPEADTPAIPEPGEEQASPSPDLPDPEPAHAAPLKAEPAAQIEKPIKSTAKSAPAAKAPSPVETPGFTGTLVTGDEVLTASMVVGPEIIVLWGAGHEIGSWSHTEAKIARLTYARFAIQAEGDTLTFTADDPTSLDQAITAAVPSSEEPITAPPPAAAAAPPVEPRLVPIPEGAKRPRIKGFQVAAEAPVEPVPAPPSVADISLPVDGEEFGTIADSVRARSTAATIKARRFSMTPKALLIKLAVFVVVALVVGALVYLGLLVSGGLRTGDNPTTTAAATGTTGAPVIITTAPLPTAPTTAPPPMTTLFATSASDLINRWNGLASTSEVPILLPPEMTSPFFLLLAPNVTLEGVLDPSIGNVTLRATPTGTPEGDAPIITALGLLIATADPTLDGSDRRALLSQLGLDVSDPDLAGIDGTLTYNGLGYRLVYDQPANSLAMIVTPDLASTTTTN